ncbi:MAG: DegQ family serine endoprotease [Proteobacteria bacterium]|jgi:serine protease Do|nr:DegQ family serine endoprotease [Alphaproteobacteria bacterium]NCC02554.1 DegQ family serine endoprotease [Pseudomonadota bacterium]
MKTLPQRLIAILVLLVFFISSPLYAMASAPEDGFADLAERLLPSVVNISTKQTIVQEMDAPEFEFQVPPGSPFEDFFKEFKKRYEETNPQGDEPTPQKKHKVASLGSGFVIDPKGYVVTNLHVIQDAEEITVILQDDTNLRATVVGRDKRTDLAVLKVDSKKPLTAVSFGDSDKVRIGDWILAIGNPFGLGGTVTKGIISARARDINSGPYDDYLQTDAPINRGNSGGPMFNMKGEVIGVNTAIFSPSGGSVGIGFAIPSVMAKNVVQQLIEHGETKRGWLGVRIQEVTQEIADSMEMGKARGALVSSVTEGGPAAAAGFNVGDVVIAFDGKLITEMQKLPRIVAETDVGKTVNVTLLRKGKELTLKVKVGKLEQEDEEEGQAEAPAKKSVIKSDKIDLLGINVAQLTDELRKKYDLGKGVSGLLIVSVQTSGLAADFGLKEGDVISQVAQADVVTSEQLKAAAEKQKKEGKPLLILVDRKGDLRFIAIPLADDKKKD